MSISARPPLARLYRRWIAANAFGELVGLGATFALIAAVQLHLGDATTLPAVALGFLAAVGAGTLEATVLAACQHWAARPWLPSLRWAAWWRATLFGALIAYALGYLPSTLMQAASPPGAAPAPEPSRGVVLLLAALLGLVGGAVLSAFQARALRGHVARAGRWIPANMLAWALGMPLVFFGLDLAFASSGALAIVVIGATLLATGAVVGGVHGLVLVGLVRATPSR